MRGSIIGVLICALLLVNATGCKKKEEGPKKLRREDIMRQAAADREAVLRFVGDLRVVFEWRRLNGASSPQAVLTRFEQISTEGLPDDLKGAWQDLLPAMRSIKPGSKVDNGIGTARARMNEALRRHGILDLKF